MAGHRRFAAPLLALLLVASSGAALAESARGALDVTGSIDVDGVLTTQPASGALLVESDGSGLVEMDLLAADVNVTRVVIEEAGPAPASVYRVRTESSEFTQAALSLGAPHMQDTLVVLESDALHADASHVALTGPRLNGVTKFVAVLGARAGEADVPPEAEDPAADYKFIAEDTFLVQTTAATEGRVVADSAVLYVYGADLAVETADGAETFTTGRTTTGDAAGLVSAHRERSFLVVRLAGVDGSFATDGSAARWFQDALVGHVDGGVAAAKAEGTMRVDGKEHPAQNEAVTMRGAFDVALTRTTPGDAPVNEYGRTLDRAFRADVDGDVTYISVTAAAPTYQGAAAAAAVVTSVAGLAAVAIFWHQVKYWLTVAFLPLYTRLKEPEILENEARHQIYEIIRTNPGISARAIHRAAGQSWGTVVYHLRQLERHHLVTSKRVGRSRNYYENHGKYRGMEVELATLKAPRALQVADAVLTEPGLTQERLAELTAFPQPTASYYVRKLKDAGVIEEQRIGRYAHYYPSDALERLVQLARNNGDEPPAAGSDGQTASTA